MSSASLPGLEAGIDLLGHELLAEKASALSVAELRMVAALKALAAFDASPPAERGGREPLLAAAGEAAWAFLIQRELMGFRDQRAVIRDYGITPEVMLRMGVVGPAKPRT